MCFDSYQAALDPFFEEFGQTMDVFAKEFKADKRTFNLDILDKFNLNNLIEEVLTQAYGKEVAEEVVTGKKKIEEVLKDRDSIASKFTGQQLAQAKKV